MSLDELFIWVYSEDKGGFKMEKKLEENQKTTIKEIKEQGWKKVGKNFGDENETVFKKSSFPSQILFFNSKTKIITQIS